jgi:hypothetical protein
VFSRPAVYLSIPDPYRSVRYTYTVTYYFYLSVMDCAIVLVHFIARQLSGVTHIKRSDASLIGRRLDFDVRMSRVRMSQANYSSQAVIHVELPHWTGAFAEPASRRTIMIQSIARTSSAQQQLAYKLLAVAFWSEDDNSWLHLCLY